MSWPIHVRRPRHASTALGLLLALALQVVPAAAPPVAAAGGLDVRGSTSYVLDPAARSVHVRAALTIRNVKPDTPSVRYYFTGYALGVQREATRIRATSGGKRLTLKTKPHQSFLEVQVEFGRRIFRGDSIAVRLDFDLPDGGTRSESKVRVGTAFAAFHAYAFGEERAAVRITVPAGFEVLHEGSDLGEERTEDGRTVLTAEGITRVDRWAVWVAADRPDALGRDRVELTLAGRQVLLDVRAWPEDSEWAATVSDRLRRGLPVLGELIGLPWPVSGPLEVLEVYTPLLGGYAGFYDAREGEIRITEDPDEQVILHEASHAWFKGDLFAERWISEGMADEYSRLALERLGSTGLAPEPVDPTAPGSFPLNDWPPPERIVDDESDARASYGYNASWTVVATLMREIGIHGMRAVLAAAQAREAPYAPAGTQERISFEAVDWRSFLDYLEQRAGSREAEQLFRTWVVTDEQALQLDARAEAREAYAELVAAGGGWQPPPLVRVPMERWRFSEARASIEAARRVLAERERSEALAKQIGAQLGSALERAYEGARDDLRLALDLAAEERRTLETVAAARLAVDRERDLLVNIGLIGESPEGPLASAYAALAEDDLPAARAGAAGALGKVESASQRGTQRVAVGGALGGTAVAVGLAVGLRRRRRVISRSMTPAEVTDTATGAAADSPGPSPEATAAPATLPRDPDPAAARRDQPGTEG
ncbi:MAG TPA: hypothetical protein VFK38_03695 [Candidatus Limnocylindrales bacterium]|nr:hypothetical protein [Candidatus Limnocylindrales bacterium]